MEIYVLARPDTNMASFSTESTYNTGAINCKKCSRRQNEQKSIIEPVQIMFIPSRTTELGDFSYDQVLGPYVAITERVKKYLITKNYPFTFQPIEILPPTTKKDTLHFPVTEHLFFLDCNKYLSIEMELSGLKSTEPCPICGKTLPKWINGEQVIISGDKKNDTVFRLHPYESRGIYVTEIFIDDMLKQGFTNINLSQFRKIGRFK